MNWTSIKILWHRELRDLLRDRGTLFMIVVLPTFLYPLMTVIGFAFALGAVTQPSVIGIAGAEHLPPLSPRSAGFSPVPTATWLALAPPGGVERVAGTLALVQAVRRQQDYPPLVIGDHFPDVYWEIPLEGLPVRAVALPSAERGPLDAKQVDVLLIVPPDLLRKLDTAGQPVLEVFTRDGDERSRLAERRLKDVLRRWKFQVQQVRLRRRGLPPEFDDAVGVRTPQRSSEPLHQTTEELADLVARFFPFMLIMWAMAGALYPAIDVCAGEKERGTLETLLLSPATRAEIVVGKFLAVWLFSAATALWNFAWMGGGAWAAGFWLPFDVLRTSGLVWCAVLGVLLSALFSAVSLALGAYARSTKEGQYYLLPLFLVTLPLTFLALVPGVELNLMFSLVPITGTTLLLQKLMTPHPEATTWLYFVPVLVSLAASISLALWWAVVQFRREQVLFREAERLPFGAWLRRVLGKKPKARIGREEP